MCSYFKNQKKKEFHYKLYFEFEKNDFYLSMFFFYHVINKTKRKENYFH